MAIELKGVSVLAAERALVKDIHLHIRAGEQVALIGPSGAGKTTLLGLMATAISPSQGHICLLGQDPWTLSARTLRRLRAQIGLAPQSPPLPARQRVITSVLAGRLGQWPLWRSLCSLLYPLDPQGAATALQKVQLDDKLYHLVDNLSGGERQRVMIARLLYQAPSLILMDEPVSALDPYLSRRVISVMVDEARRRNATLVTSLHAVDLALQHFPRIIGIHQGRIVFDRKPHEIDTGLLNALYAGAESADSRPLLQPGLRSC